MRESRLPAIAYSPLDESVEDQAMCDDSNCIISDTWQVRPVAAGRGAPGGACR